MEIRGGRWEIIGIDILENHRKRIMVQQKGEDGWSRQFSIELPDPIRFMGKDADLYIEVVGYGAAMMRVLDKDDWPDTTSSSGPSGNEKV